MKRKKQIEAEESPAKKKKKVQRRQPLPFSQNPQTPIVHAKRPLRDPSYFPVHKRAKRAPILPHLNNRSNMAEDLPDIMSSGLDPSQLSNMPPEQAQALFNQFGGNGPDMGADPEKMDEDEDNVFDEWDNNDEKLAADAGEEVDNQFLKVKQDKKDPTKREFDFRFKKPPDGVKVVGGEMCIVEQEDGCTFLDLPPESHLLLDLNEIQPSGGERVNNWIIIIDMEMKNLPRNDTPLIQTCYPEYIPDKDVCILKESGNLGMFQFGEEPNHWFKPGNWQRVIITKKLGSFPRTGGVCNQLRTYVNGKLCSQKLDIGFGIDGRFSLDKNGIMLFASSHPQKFPGCHIKRIQVNSRCFEEHEVKATNFSNSVYSQWLQEQQNKDAMVMNQLSLSPLYTRPPCTWRDPGFLGQFADAYVAGTNIGGSGIYGALKTFNFVLQKMWNEQKDWLLKVVGEEMYAHCAETLRDVVNDACSLSRKFELAKKGPAPLVSFIRGLRKILNKMEVGKKILIPGGICNGNMTQNMMYVVERKGENDWRFLVINTGYGNSYHPKQAQEHPKIKYKNTIVFNGIPTEKILDNAWWLFILRLMAVPNQQYSAETLYDFLLPYLWNKPLEDALVDSELEFDWRTPQRSRCSAYRSVMETYYYLLRNAGLEQNQVKLIFFNLRRQYMKLILHDLNCVSSVTESDVRLITLATQQLSYHAVKLGEKKLLSLEELNEVRSTVNIVQEQVNAAEPRSANDYVRDIQYEEAPLVLNLLDGGPPPPLDLDTGSNDPYEWFNLNMFQRTLREEDVNGYAGDPIPTPRFVPIDTMKIPERAEDFESCLTALRWCDKLCTKYETQQGLVKHWFFLKVALCEHVFTKVLPIPKPGNSPDLANCPWNTELRYALQLDVLILLQRLAEHFASAACGIHPSRQLFAVRITVSGAMAAIADVVMRKVATDIPSELCEVLCGQGYGTGFGLGPGYFGTLSETIPVVRPSLNIARTGIIDYFDNSGVPPDSRIMCWEKQDNMMVEDSMLTLLSELSGEFPFPMRNLPAYLCQGYVPKNYPEWECYRDVNFLFKMMMTTKMDTFPAKAPWVQASASLRWSLRDGVYFVQGFRIRKLSCVSRGHIFPSMAIPAFYCDDKPKTEDDVLFVENSRLPNFDDLVTQRDSELLLSYMTVPYLRLPLILSFFATNDRVHCLKSDKLKDLLDAVLFEPGRYLPVGMNQAPTMVPTENPTLLCTPYGLLFNELQRSPEGIIKSMMDLLKLALDLDIGTYKTPNADIVRFVVRIACRFENYMTFVIQHATDTHPHIRSSRLRDAEIDESVVEILKKARFQLRVLLRGHCHNMFETWIDQALKEVEGTDTESAKKMDENVKIACNLYAHLVLCYRNTLKDELGFRSVITLLSSFIFLSSRHSWNLGLLEVNEVELFETMQNLRRGMIDFLNACPRTDFNQGLEAIVRVTSGAGRRVAAPGDVIRGWGKLKAHTVKAASQNGRYVTTESDLKRQLLNSQNPQREVEFVLADRDFQAEINLHTLQLTLLNAHIQALPTNIAGTIDVQTVFKAEESMQCAEISKTTHRTWHRLVGRYHDVQTWDKDTRPMDIVTYDRPYDPAFVGMHERWIVPLFEPVRTNFFVPPAVKVEFPFMLPEQELGPDARICVLQCVEPNSQQLYKEVIIYKDLKMVEIYDIPSHGRRFYRSCVFSTNARFSLHFKQESLKGRRSPPPAQFLHMVGNPHGGVGMPFSCVITREAHLPGNFSGTEELYVPERLLYGIIPSQLLSTHLFWQDDNDNLRGYPIDERERHILLVEWEKKSIEGWGMEDAVARISKRFLQRDNPRRDPDKETMWESTQAEEETGLYNEKGARTRPELSSRELDRGNYNDDEEIVLLNCLYAPRHTPLHSMIQVLTRMETLSHILCWTKNCDCRDPTTSVSIDLVELPRLKLTFRANMDGDGVTRLYSVDHSDLFVSNERRPLIEALIRGIPHSLILSNAHNETQILVPSIEPIRPPIGTDPFSTWLVLNRANSRWLSVCDPPYYLYPVHVSLSFMFTKTLGSALYLILLRFLNRNYDAVYRLSTSISTDTDFNPEQEMIFDALKYCGDDFHPNAHAVRARISLMTQDSPCFPPWDLPDELSKLVVKWPHISSTCRMDRQEELQVFQEAEGQLKKMHIIKELWIIKSKEEKAKLAQDILQPDPGQTKQEEKKAQEFINQIREKIESKLGVTVNDNLIKRYLVKVIKRMFLDEYHDCLLFNRVRYLESHVDGLRAAQIKVPKSDKTSDWHLHYDKGAFHCHDNPWQMTKMRYKCPMALNGHMNSQVIDALWNRKPEEKENLRGDQIGYGFLFIYQLFTKTIRCRIGKQDDSFSFARLCSRLYMDMFMETNSQKDEFGNIIIVDCPENTFFASILSIISQNPNLCDILPKFKDTRTHKSQIIQGFVDDENPISPLDNLFQDLMPILQSMQSEVIGNFDKSTFAKLADPPLFCKVVKYENPNILEDVKDLENVERTAVSAQLTNFLCDKRKLDMFDMNALRLPLDPAEADQVADALNVEESTIKEFATVPLQKLIGFVSFGDPAEQVDENLPFDISGHSYAESEVAEKLIVRLTKDQKIYADRVNNGKVKELISLDRATVENFVKNGHGEASAQIDETLKMLQELREHAMELKKNDDDFVDAAIPVITRTANYVDLSDASFERMKYLLQRHAGRETNMWINYLIGSLISDRAEFDLLKLNPYIDPKIIEELEKLIMLTLFHANRHGQTNEVLGGIKNLEKELLSAKLSPENRKKEDEALLAGLLIRVKELATLISKKRYYVGEDMTFDPRYLLFEFTWNITLRDRQVEIVQEFYGAIKNGESLVRQMIMGAGKTTVVSPLINLMVADGKNLMVQVVPPQLLEFSRSRLRETFSSIMQKRIYTFHFDRSSKIDPQTFQKFQNAIRTAGVIVTTPTSIKSLMLKYLECLHYVADEHSKRPKDLNKMTQNTAKALRFFNDSVLMMDEVDLILHPLKSELNFPIGAKFPLDFNPLRWKLPIHLLDAVFYATRGKMSVGFEGGAKVDKILEAIKVAIDEGYEKKALQKTPHVILLNEEYYHSTLKPLMADWALVWLEINHFKGIDQDEQKQYILKGPFRVGDISARVEDLCSVDHKKMLNLVHDWLRSFLPHVLCKVDRVSYGIMTEEDKKRAKKIDPLMPATRFKMAIPFVGKDVPSRSSEFAHPDVIIGLSVLAYRYEGLRYSDFVDVIAELRTEAIKETIPWPERKAVKRYNRWVEDAGGVIRDVHKYTSLEEQLDEDVKMADGEEELQVVPLKLLKRSNEDQMEELFEVFRKVPDVIHHYLQKMIFPTYMMHQAVKLSASGQELGGQLLFNRRIGFSGTPSDLLPKELGRCGYEAGSDGKMLTFMTDTNICDYKIMPEGWTVHKVLDRIAQAGDKNDDQRFNALIDTGALITGMSNYEVARYLLDNGLEWAEGVVFLDNDDKQQILVRATGRVVQLSQCGIEKENRFAFYDQIHTTGMDIKHVYNATAVLTLGKDMVFRDYAQGAFRMRGIGKGQKICLYVIPEIQDLISRELSIAWNGCCEQMINDAVQNVKNEEVEKAKNSGIDIEAWQALRKGGVDKAMEELENDYREKGFNPGLIRHLADDRFEKQQYIRDRDALVKQTIDALLENHEQSEQIRSFESGLEKLIEATRMETENNFPPPFCPWSESTHKQILVDVSAWLNICSMRSERLQWTMLCTQNYTNVYRKQAWSTLLSNSAIWRVHEQGRNMVLDVRDPEMYHDFISRPGLNVVKYGSSKHGHCLYMDPIFDEVAKENTSPTFLNVDIDVCASLVNSEGIDKNQLPLFRFFVNGDVFDDEEFFGPNVEMLREKVSRMGGLFATNENLEIPEPDSHSQLALNVFHESIDFSLEGCVPKPRKFAEVLQDKVQGQQDFVVTEEDRNTLKEIENTVGSSVHDGEEMAYLQEIVAHAEQQEEQQKEKDQEREVELEVFVAKDWNRDDEEPTPWPFESLATISQHSMVPQFYPAHQFKLWKRESVGFPGYMQVSENYFDPKWSGERRIKNVVMILEIKSFLGSKEEDGDEVMLEPPAIMRRLTTGTSDTMRKCFQYLGFDEENEDLSQHEETLHMAVRAAMDFKPTFEQLEEIQKQFANKHGVFGLQDFEEFIRSDLFRVVERDRYFVAVSLAEAETLRRIIHLKKKELLVGSDTQMSLRCKTADYRVFDNSQQFQVASDYQNGLTHHCFQYLDCDTYFKDKGINLLLRGMQETEMIKRRLFFQQIIGCKRRLQKTWDKTPIQKFFRIKTEFHFLKLRALTFRIRYMIEDLGLLPWDAFRLFNVYQTGLLSGPELWGALEFLDIHVTAYDLLELLRTYDLDGDGNLSSAEFFAMIQDPDMHEEQAEEYETNLDMMSGIDFGDVKIEPKTTDGDQTLDELMEQIIQEEANEKVQITNAVNDADLKVTGLKDAAKAERRMEKGLPPNPDWQNESLVLDYTDTELPIGGKMRGVKENLQGGNDNCTKVQPEGFIIQTIRHFDDNINAHKLMPFQDDFGYINAYTIQLEVNFDQRPKTGEDFMGLFHTLRETKEGTYVADAGAGIVVTASGEIGVPEFYGALSNDKVPFNNWCLLTITVNCHEGRICCFANGLLVWEIANNVNCVPDGAFAMHSNSGFGIFAAKKTTQMNGGLVKSVQFAPRIFETVEILQRYEAWSATANWVCPICTVVNSLNSGTCEVCGHQREQATSKNDNPIISQIVAMGFPRNAAELALNQGYETLEEVTQFVLSQISGDPPPPLPNRRPAPRGFGNNFGDEEDLPPFGNFN